jgi:hypothetical protein
MKSWLKGWLDPVSGAIALILVLVILEKFGVVGHSLVTVVVVLATLIFVFDMNHKYRKDRREGPYSKVARLEKELEAEREIPEVVHRQVIGYLKGKASLRLEEAANCDDPLSAEHEAELLESAALILEKNG